MNFVFISLTDWGYPSTSIDDATCNDNTDKVMNSTTSSDKPCDGSNYFSNGYNIEAPTSWLWFQCINNQKCIHIDSRCDMHPNPACIYEKDGVMVAEDEEGCFDEYKRKNLVSKIINVICSNGSHDHNTMSPAVMTTTYDWVNDEYIDVIVIPKGTTVQIPGIRCDGIYNCWDGIDEEFCGFTPFHTVGIGNNSKI